MTRYKGRPKLRAVERDFPHMVEITVPLGGLGKRLDAMHSFHGERGLQHRNGCRRRDRDGRDHIRWCFGDPATADEFASLFGGRRLIEPMPKHDPIALIEWGKWNIQRK